MHTARSGRDSRTIPVPATSGGGVSFRRLAALTALIAVVSLLLGGTTASAQTQTPTGDTLVGNDEASGAMTGQDLTYDTAQQFTTGGAPDGYTLTDVDLDLWRLDTAGPDYRVRIHVDSGGRPGVAVGELTNPGSLPTGPDQLSRFTSSGGIHLDAGTRYWIVIDAVDGVSSGRLTTTHANGENPGSEAGWSIANNSLRRWNFGGGWQYRNPALQVRLNGHVSTLAEVRERNRAAAESAPDHVIVHTRDPNAWPPCNAQQRHARANGAWVFCI